MNSREHFASFLLRAGLATVFLFAAIAATLQPYSWVGFFPQALRDVVAETWLLHAFSLYEVILAFWLLWGRQAFWAGVVAGGTMVAILVVNVNGLEIVFRDVAILFAAAALCVLHLRPTQS